MDPITVVFFGRSGAGKGTQADLLVSHLREHNADRSTLYIETGAQFRELMQGKSYTGELTRQVVEEGKLVPVFLPIWVWTNYFIANFTGKENVVFDGVCRRLEEAPAFDSAMNFYDRSPIHIIHLEVGRDRATAHLKGRGRADDTDDNIARRLTWYETDVVPTLEFFRGIDRYNFHSINGEQTIPAVHADILSAIGVH
jgi:adenylate kinase